MRIEAKDGAVVEVRTFREGMLSAVGHDLALRASRFHIDLDGEPEQGTIRAVIVEVDPSSLVVDGAVVHGAVDRSVLSAHDRRDIERSLHEDVLASREPVTFRAASVRADGEGYALDGTLTLAGHARPVSARVLREGDALVANVSLHQPDFGIRPFRAMLGALKVRADVTVIVRVPRAALRLA